MSDNAVRLRNSGAKAEIRPASDHVYFAAGGERRPEAGRNQRKNTGALPGRLIQFAVDGERARNRWNREKYGLRGKGTRNTQEERS